MEKHPDFRIVGNVTPEVKEAVQTDLHSARTEDTLTGMPEDLREKIHRLEYKKYEGFLRIAEFANRKTDEMLVSLGLEPVDISSDNIHILPFDVYKELGGDAGSEGFSDQVNQAIFLNVDNLRNNSISMATILFHEMLHLKSHFSMEVNEKTDGQEKRTTYRTGLVVKALQKDTDEGRYYRYFWGLNEAVVASQETKLLKELESEDIFAEDVAWMNSPEILKLKSELAMKKGIPEDEIQWISTDKKTFSVASYEKYRDVFTYVLHEIMEQFPDTYPTLEEVEKEFLKAHFTGHLLGIGKLVESTFGAGSFRVLGTMKNEDGTSEFSAQEVKKKLEEMRAGIKQNS